MRLLYLVSHPIQYQAPLLRRVAALPGIDFTALFEDDRSLGTFHDDGFKRRIAWDVPLTEGYDHAVVRDPGELARRLAGTDALWLHGWDSRLRLGALALARKAGVPVLMRGENTPAAMPDGRGLRGVLKRRYLGWIFARCAAFLCIGSANRAYYRAHGIGEERLFDMPYAVDNAFFAARAAEAAGRRQAFRAELGLEAGRPVVLYAGKLMGRKHPLALLDAFARLDHEALGRPYLLYVGDGELRDEMAARAAPLADSVRLLGFRNQSELPAFYDLADLFVLASSREPWGLAVNEAMACGCAVIVSDECGCAADLVGPDCGAVVPPGDAAALAAALAAMLGDPARMAAMGAAARRRIAEWDFDADLRGLKSALDHVRARIAA